MLDLITPFIISQILVTLAIVTDFVSFQFENRKYTVMYLAVSSILICVHYLLLNKFTAGIIVSLSAIRFIVSYFTTNKKILLIFIILNTIVLFFTFKEFYDLIFYAGITIFMIGNFQDQKHNELMRILMMSGTSVIILYNALIFSPMAILTESIFLVSNLIGYYRFYIKKQKK